MIAIFSSNPSQQIPVCTTVPIISSLNQVRLSPEAIIELGSTLLCLKTPRLTRVMPFKQEAPKRFFKALFIETPCGTALEKTMPSKAVPDGCKSQECNYGGKQRRLNFKRQ